MSINEDKGLTYKSTSNQTIEMAASSALSMANRAQQPVYLEHNGITIKVEPILGFVTSDNSDRFQLAVMGKILAIAAQYNEEVKEAAKKVSNQSSILNKGFHIK